MEAIVRVPEGKVVVLDRETRDILEGVRNVIAFPIGIWLENPG